MTRIQANITLSTLLGTLSTLKYACTHEGKLQTNYAVPTFCDFNHRVM